MNEIAPVRPALLLEALQLLYSPLPAEERQEQCRQALLNFSQGQFSADDFLAATRAERIVGVLFAMRQPGQCAFLWPPVIDEVGIGEGEPADACADVLLQTLGRRFDEAGILFTQCLLPLEEGQPREVLNRNGFTFRGELLFLSCDLAKPLDVEPSAVLEFVTPVDETLTRFARMVEQTYHGSLDCPCLEGIRSGEAALESHRSAGQFDQSLWRLYQWEGADAGIILLSRQDEPESWEVVYMGVAPEFRGLGIGKAMMRAALEQARARGAKQMHLAVDSRNQFARRIYSDLGFDGQGLRAVHLRLRGAPEDA